jgi:hypothetical protein
MVYFTPAFGVRRLGGHRGHDPLRARHRAREHPPHRGSWLIWGVLAIVACVAQLADGASWSAVMTGTQAVVTGAVFLLAIRYGEGGMSATDLCLTALPGGGVIGWILIRQPIGAVGGALTTGAVGMFDLSLLAYPAYYCLANGALAILIYRQRAAGSQKVP